MAERRSCDGESDEEGEVWAREIEAGGIIVCFILYRLLAVYCG